MKRLDILLMDHDTGITFSDVCEQAEASGISKLIDDQQAVFAQLLLQTQQALLIPGFEEFVHQR